MKDRRSRIAGCPLVQPYSVPRTPSSGRSSTSCKSRGKERKLLDLYYADKIDPDGFATEQWRLKAQITSIEKEIVNAERTQRTQDAAADRFDAVSEILTQPDIDLIWDSASASERRTLIEDLLDSIRFFPDQLTVQISGAPPILVTLEEVGLRGGGRSVVSETGLEPTRP
ncbi:MAG: hypothetical protein WAK12_03800 [Acidimicrobiales bacterium]